MFTLSLRFADASLLAPFDYMALVWSAIIGFMLWGSVPQTAVLYGVGLVVFGGIISLYCERHSRRRVTSSLNMEN